MVKNTGKGYAEFESEADAGRCLREVDGCEVEGRRIQVLRYIDKEMWVKKKGNIKEDEYLEESHVQQCFPLLIQTRINVIQMMGRQTKSLTLPRRKVDKVLHPIKDWRRVAHPPHPKKAETSIRSTIGCGF